MYVFVSVMSPALTPSIEVLLGRGVLRHMKLPGGRMSRRRTILD